jgi:asparagine synthase (glutamine-hydrolysing)
MCGIAGIARTGQTDATLRERVTAMTGAIRHRGPDGSGVYGTNSIAIGHARLSIIDLSDAAAQPMIDEATQCVLVYNGEVYNFPLLRLELEALGHTFRSRSDSEVILRGYLEWGESLPQRLEGMFAFAIWDPRIATLLLVRDRLGIKPLYVEQVAHELRFASEIKAILAGSPGRRQVDADGLAEFCWFGNALRERTTWAGIERLLPGHAIAWTHGTVRRWCWWSPTAIAVTRSTGSAAELQALLDKAVQRHLISDVPVGVFLSGGVDSSAVTMLAARHASAPIHSFTASFDFADNQPELALARLVSQRAGTVHHEMRVSAADVDHVVQTLAEAHDEPFADAADVPLYLLCRGLGHEVKVVLQGDGGDELFGGYRRYALLRHLGTLGPLSRAAAPLLRAVPGITAARACRMVDALGTRDRGERMARLLTVDTPRHPPIGMLGPAWRARVGSCDAFQAYRNVASMATRGDDVDRMQLTDMQLLLPDTFLEKVDKSTMALGVEVRVPFLDSAVVDYGLSLPASIKMPRGRAKGLLKDALAGVVPPEVLAAPKRGFGEPYRAWISGPLRPLLQRLVHDVPDRARGAMDVAWVDQRLAEHSAGRADHGFALWKALQLALWLHRYDVAL